MPRFGKFAAGISLALALAAGATYHIAQQALHEVQPFYRAALSADPRELANAADELDDKMAQLADSPVDQWHAVFTAREINAWLAEWLVEDGQERLPSTVSDVRIAIEDEQLLVGFRYAKGRVDTVITVVATATSIGANEIELTLCTAHAGALPLPLANVKRQIDTVADHVGIPIAWSVVDDLPVAHVDLAIVLAATAPQRELSSMALGDGEVQIAGRTLSRGERKAVRTALQQWQQQRKTTVQ